MNRIMFWCEAFWPRVGGVEVLAARLLAALQQRGYRFVVLTDQYPPERPPYQEYQGTPIYSFPYGRTLLSRNPRAILDLRARIGQLKRAFRPNLVHVYYARHDAFFHLGTQAIAPAPVVCTLHNSEPPSTLAPDTAIGQALRHADRITACSAAALAHTLRHVPEILPRAMVIRNALPLLDTASLPLPCVPPVLLCIGRLEKQKGFDLALRALALLYRRFPGVSLLIAGDGRERASLECQAVELGIAHAVTFLGWVDLPDVPALLNRATVLLMPSRHEGLPLVAVQAAQMGRPIVGTAVGGMPEIVLDGRTGMLVEPEDPHALAAALTRLLDPPDLAMVSSGSSLSNDLPLLGQNKEPLSNDLPLLGQMGQAAAVHARSAFRWEDHVDAYDTLYRQMIEQAADAGTMHAPRC